MVVVQFFLLLVFSGAILVGSASPFLPDGSLRPGARITIRAGEEKEFLFRPEGVRFLSGRARLISVGGPLIDPDGRERKEIVIDAERSPGIPWIHDEKPFRLRIRAETDFTLEARESWEWDPGREPEKKSRKPHAL
jgi:hypothetical protein